MRQKNHISSFTKVLTISFIILITTVLFACSSTSETSEPGEASKPSGEASTEAAQTDATSTDVSKETSTTAATQAPAEEPAVEPDVIEPPRIVESCKDEPYLKYEKQARESIAKGLAATKAEKFGVGFRSVNEHNTWSKVHSELFKQVNAACGALSECAKTHKKDKDTECVEQAKTFDEWQKLAKSFAAKAKTAETTQPPKICSPSPNLDDAARCFHSLADNVDKACDSPECKETSDCWRTVGFLDAAIIQAEQSCGFIHQKLSDCRSYTEATNRRKNKFNQCKDMQGRLNITVLPVL